MKPSGHRKKNTERLSMVCDMTDEKLRSSCMNVLEGAKEMGAKFYAAPFGISERDHMIDVTDIIIAALEKVVERRE